MFKDAKTQLYVQKPCNQFTHEPWQVLLLKGKTVLAPEILHTKDEIHIGCTGKHSQGITTGIQGIAHPEGLLAWGPMILWASA